MMKVSLLLPVVQKADAPYRGALVEVSDLISALIAALSEAMASRRSLQTMIWKLVSKESEVPRVPISQFLGPVPLV